MEASSPNPGSVSLTSISLSQPSSLRTVVVVAFGVNPSTESPRPLHRVVVVGEVPRLWGFLAGTEKTDVNCPILSTRCFDLRTGPEVKTVDCPQ